jgi:hypothetical protein
MLFGDLHVHMETGNLDEARRLALIAHSSPVYGTSLGKKDVERLERLLEDTGSLPRDPDADDQTAGMALPP